MGFRKKVIPKKDNYMKHRESSLSHIWPQHTKRISLKKNSQRSRNKGLAKQLRSSKFRQIHKTLATALARGAHTHTPYKP